MKKIKQLLILLFGAYAAFNSCDKNEIIDPEPNKIELKDLKFLKANETSAKLKAVVTNSNGYEFGIALSKNNFNKSDFIDSCIFYKVENNLKDTILLEIKNLMPSTTYYGELYYKHEDNYTFNKKIKFKTREKVDIVFDTLYDIEQNMYKTITIGEQSWMAQNLRTTTYNDGEPINHLLTDEQWHQDSVGGYCWYENNIDYKNSVGALYNGYTIETTKLCPTGWHIPSDDDWHELIEYLNNHGFENYHAEALKTEYGWIDNSNGQNHYGFSALPSGYRNEIGGSHDIMSFAGYWSSDKNHLSQHFVRKLNTNSTLQPWIANRNVGMAVRCIKDAK
jgi:uncharacterized protein (TIGR02145 family)